MEVSPLATSRVRPRESVVLRLHPGRYFQAAEAAGGLDRSRAEPPAQTAADLLVASGEAVLTNQQIEHHPPTALLRAVRRYSSVTDLLVYGSDALVPAIECARSHSTAVRCGGIACEVIPERRLVYPELGRDLPTQHVSAEHFARERTWISAFCYQQVAA